MPDPIQGPGISPVPGGGEPGKGPEKPKVGEGQPEQKPFTMPSGAEKTSAPSPMEVARNTGPSKQLPPEELSEHVNKAQNALKEAQTKLNNPAIQKNLTEEHFKALDQVKGKMNGDLRQIAENSGSQYEPSQPLPDDNPVQRLAKWINGSQSTLTGALNYLSQTKNPNIASYMKLQYGVQRATQRAELFSSIVGSSVSGLKTLMSTQLG